MKNIFESEETFTAYATIEAGMFMIEELQTEIDKFNKGRSPIEIAVDEATGFAADKQKKHIARLQACLLDIIAAKKVIEAEYKNEENLLLNLQTLK